MSSGSVVDGQVGAMDWIASFLLVVFAIFVSLGAGLAMSDVSATEFIVAKCFQIAAGAVFAMFTLYSVTNAAWPTIPKVLIASLVGGLLLPAIVGSLIWTDYREDRQKLSRESKTSDQIIKTLTEVQSSLNRYGYHDSVIAAILAKHKQLQDTMSLFEALTGKIDRNTRLTIAQSILNDLNAAAANIQTTAQLGPGGALIIKTGPNTFRLVFPVPMRVPPTISFDVPAGSTPNIIERSIIGITVVFTPPSIPIESLPPMIASAEP